jgi:polyhydroxybutyrate depolymerase
VAVLLGICAVLAVALVVAVVALVRAGGSTDEAVAGAPPSTAPDATLESTTTVAVRRDGAPSGGGRVEGGVRIQTVTIAEGIVQRPYTVFSPADAQAGERLPVVVVLHGLGVTSQAISRAADWRGAVAQDRFVAVFPQGILDSWNAGPCCPPAKALGTDDVAFLTQVVEQVRSRPEVDAARTYLTGFSNGAIMAYSFVCARPGLVAALAPIAGSNLSGCEPQQPVSLMHLHGDPDFVVPFNGEPTLSQLVSGVPFPPVTGTIQRWADADGCAPVPRVVDAGGVSRSTWSGCTDDVRVELVVYPGNEHTWPDGPVDGLDEILRFFGIRS